MNRCYAYIRVSTIKQGERGVSLQEQRAAIEVYAAKHGLAIVEWFEERLTAAKRGRPLFTDMLKRLRKGEAHGVVMHKIDRSARNLRDWAELGELIDAGVAVHFVHDALDLHSRGGRLSADIQAVVAADYVRNLREEGRKGLTGRLKQGLYPFRAPLGYLDTGGGKQKNLDPARAPLVRQTFELYASGRYSLDSLVVELKRRGLRTREGAALTRTGLSKLLNNSFYVGIIRIKRTGEHYPGIHEPLIPMHLFKEVERRLSGRIRADKWKHDYTFRGLFTCSLCERPLIGERQKGHVYYRCHTRDCPTKSFRQETLETALLNSWPAIAVTEDERAYLRMLLERLVSTDQSEQGERRKTLGAQLAQLQSRRTRLVDAFIDQTLDKQTFEERNCLLLESERALRAQLTSADAEHPKEAETVLELLELASTAQQSYFLGDAAAKRELVIRLSSNRSVAGKQVSIEPHFPVRVLRDRHRVHCGGPYRTAARRHLADVPRGGAMVEASRKSTAEL